MKGSYSNVASVTHNGFAIISKATTRLESLADEELDELQHEFEKLRKPKRDPANGQDKASPA